MAAELEVGMKMGMKMGKGTSLPAHMILPRPGTPFPFSRVLSIFPFQRLSSQES